MSVLANAVVTLYMWLLSPQNVANASETLNVWCNLNLNSYMWLENSLGKTSTLQQYSLEIDHTKDKSLLLSFSFTLPREGSLRLMFSLVELLWQFFQPRTPLAYFPYIIVNSETLKIRGKTSENVQSRGLILVVPRQNLAHRNVYFGFHRIKNIWANI